MNDTSSKIAERVARRYAEMSPDERMQAASGMFDTARIIIESSLPATLSRRDRRIALARRLYGNELTDAAVNAFADWQDD
ncbi:MAG: hypothetical protein ABJC66_11320 [Gammaproteobacteria bacterium]